MAFLRRQLFVATLTSATISVCLLNWGIGLFHPFFNHHDNNIFQNNNKYTNKNKLVETTTSRSVLSGYKKKTITTSIQSTSSSTAITVKAASNITVYNDYYKEPYPRPPLSSLIQGWNVTGNVSWLLNYAIIGFPKCGTSSLMIHLQSHPEINIFSDERCELSYNQQVRLIEDLYRKFPTGNRIRAIKCPMDLESTYLGMRNYQKFFPNTDYIVGIRHPVLWFESFYNFRIHNGYRMPPAETMIGKCRRGWNNVCTFRSNYHIFLSNLGKTNISSDPNERQYIDQQFHKSMDYVPTNRRIFLYEVTQLSDKHEKRSIQLRNDLQEYLHLNEPISPVIWYKPGKNHTDENHLRRLEKKQINICNDTYIGLRNVLMNQAINASKWIREYFINANDVYVSSKEYFGNTLMKSWEIDPCIERIKNDKK